jgi:hypothetical protein
MGAKGKGRGRCIGIRDSGHGTRDSGFGLRDSRGLFAIRATLNQPIPEFGIYPESLILSPESRLLYPVPRA